MCGLEIILENINFNNTVFYGYKFKIINFFPQNIDKMIEESGKLKNSALGGYNSSPIHSFSV